MSDRDSTEELADRLKQAAQANEKAVLFAMNGEKEQAVEEAASAVESLLMDPEVAQTVLGGGVS